MKSWVLFILSFAVTFIVGFFILSLFINFRFPREQVFTASVLSSVQPDENPSEEGYSDGPATIPIERDLGGEPMSLQDQLDEIQEKLDLIGQQVNELLPQPEENLKEEIEETEEIEEPNLDEVDEEILEEEELLAAEEVSCYGQININTASAEDLDKIIGVGPATAQKIIQARPFYLIEDLLKVSGIGELTLQKITEQGCAFVEPGLVPPVPISGGGGSSDTTIYPQILISEVKIAEKTGDKNVFVELFNPNDAEINLTNWYIFRNGSSFVTKTMFSEKIIPAEGYFLLTREGSIWDGNSDLIFDDTLNDDDKIALKNPAGDIADEAEWLQIADDLSWCYDFAICSPTPRARNVKYVEPPPLPPPVDETPPEIVFNIAPTQSELSFDVNFTITDVAEVVTPSGLASFTFRWSDDNTNWHETEPQIILDAPLSIDLVENVSGSDGQTFYFQVKATDTAGNATIDWLPQDPAQTKIELPLAAENMLTNEFFENWTAGDTAVPPDDWTWSGTATRINQSLDGLVGNYSVQCTPITTANNLIQNNITITKPGTYYARIWVKPVNVDNDNYIRISVDMADPVDGSFPNANFTDYKDETGWVELTKTRDIGMGENGGVRIRAQRQGSIGPYFLIGAVWLGETEPPEDWPL